MKTNQRTKLKVNHVTSLTLYTDNMGHLKYDCGGWKEGIRPREEEMSEIRMLRWMYGVTEEDNISETNTREDQ